MLNAYDFEFYEDGQVIEKISLGIVREDYNFSASPDQNIAEGKALYIVFPGTEKYVARTYSYLWLSQNVMPHLYVPSGVKFTCNVNSEAESLILIEEYFKKQPHGAQLIADYGAYDHVALMQLYGPMMNKPDYLPYFTHDLQQMKAELSYEPLEEQLYELWPTFKPAEYVEHNALMDAIKTMFEALNYRAVLNNSLNVLDLGR